MPNPENLEGQGFHTNPERINKEGRPKGKTITTILKELLEQEVPESLMPKQLRAIIGDRKITHSEAGAMIQIMGMYGSISQQRIKILEMIQDRTEGKPLQKIEQSGETDMTLKIVREVIKK